MSYVKASRAFLEVLEDRSQVLRGHNIGIVLKAFNAQWDFLSSPVVTDLPKAVLNAWDELKAADITDAEYSRWLPAYLATENYLVQAANMIQPWSR